MRTSCWWDNSESERRGPEHWEHREDNSITGIVGGGEGDNILKQHVL